MAVKDINVKSPISMNGGRVKSAGTPIDSGDLVNKEYLDSLLNQSYFLDSVDSIQVDNSLVPSKVVSPASRYIITNKDSLNAQFGGIAGLGNNDIVEWNGSSFVVVTDVSTVDAEFMLAYIEDIDKYYQYTKATNTWGVASGLNEIEFGNGLSYDEISGLLQIDSSVVVQKKEFVIGNGVDSDYVVTHNLSNDLPSVTVKDTGTNELLKPYIEFTSNMAILLSFSPIPGVNQIKVTVEG